MSLKEEAMNIKETEKEVGIRKANIRYYEDQGLIIPKRNQANNYRDYSEEDIRILKKIKTLRLLGISVADIKELQEDKAALDEILEKRITEIEGELAGLKETKELCRMLQERSFTYEALDLSLVNMWESLSLRKGADFMSTDRSRDYEGMYQKVSHLFTGYVFLISLPTSQVIQTLLHYKLPGWMTLVGSVGFVLFAVMNLAAFLCMTQEKVRMQREGARKLHAGWGRNHKSTLKTGILSH